MKRRLSAWVLYIFYWMIIFISGRLYFLIFNFSRTSDEKLTDIAGTFLHGALLDVSTTGYYMLLPTILLIPALFFPGKWYVFFLRFYTFILVVFTSLIIVVDANLYTYWGFRMDYTPFFYLRTPGEALASVESGMILLLAFIFILLCAIFILLYRRYVDKYVNRNVETSKPVINSIFILFLAAALIIPIRGGFDVAPVNAGSVYFSDRMFINHAAINVVWNVGTTAVTAKPVENPYMFNDKSVAENSVKSLFRHDSINHESLVSVSKPNVLIMILESFSSYIAGPASKDLSVTPYLNRFAAEGIYFNQIYASGTRTDKALPAILNGYPAQPAQSIIKEPRKTQNLESMVKAFINEGYSTSFWYGGEIDFANFNSFVIASGFQEIISKDNFPPETYNTKWGVHDHVLLEAFKASFDNRSDNFFKVLLTLSSHEPFDVPMEPVYPGDDQMSKYRNSVYYSDKAVGEFIEWAKTTEWWDSTLVILVADHAARINAEMEPWSAEIFKIPMIWTGGAIKKSGVVIEKIGNQTDIAQTLVNQLNMNHYFPYSKDLLSDDSQSFSFYTFNEGFGFITDSSAIAYDHKAKRIVLQEGKASDREEVTGKAFLQVLFDDYLGR